MTRASSRRAILPEDHLEYRAGIFQGFRAPGSKNSFRFVGRLQYDVFDVEKVPFYPGTYLGKKKILAFGGGLRRAGTTTRVTRATSFRLARREGQRHHGTGRLSPLRRRQDVHVTARSGGTPVRHPHAAEAGRLFVEAGFYVGALKLMPFAHYESESFSDDANKPQNVRRHVVLSTSPSTSSA